jgi:hypothetical protein
MTDVLTTTHGAPTLGGDYFNGRALNYHLSQQHVVIISMCWPLAVVALAVQCVVMHLNKKNAGL